MHAAIVTSWGAAPTHTAVPDLPAPAPTQIRLRVLAAGIHRLVQARAAGTHYTSTALPHTPGVDGVGEDPSTGKRYYFSSLPLGSFAEYVNAERAHIAALPEAADPVTAAAFMNPIMSSWMALSARAGPQEEGFSVAILGATSASGRVAIDVVRAKGASRIVGIARNAAALEKLPLDERITLGAETDWSRLGEVDVVLDYVYGPAAAALLGALPKSTREVQYVQIGSVGGDGEMSLSGAVLRGKRVTVRGAGFGSWTMDEYAKQLGAMVEVATTLKRENVLVAPFTDVEKAWGEAGSGSKRVVLVSEDLAKE
ncbi:quinone oxidoreductase [Colletotrichum sojae]|uniref:Quinone oxidoreductase n=1 Tax=Colletotrichum sojae TaxID=2175907 RepID=A0A8H6N1Y4_9PEZI|nr:quinone oxidoreductase [Colletotrichum sojae]